MCSIEKFSMNPWVQLPLDNFQRSPKGFPNFAHELTLHMPGYAKEPWIHFSICAVGTRAHAHKSVCKKDPPV